MVAELFGFCPSGLQGATLVEAGNVLSHWYVTKSLKYEPLSYAGVQSQINKSAPIYTSCSSGSVNHANVIRGYDDNGYKVSYIDPKDGGYHVDYYVDYVNGYHWDGIWWSWVQTIFDTKV